MLILFASAACPALDFSSAAAMAETLGFDGVELHAQPLLASATNVLLTATTKIRRCFDQANTAILSLNVGPAGRELSDRIALAADLGSPVVRLKSEELFSGNQKASARAVDWIIDSGDRAAASHITLLIENKPIVGSALAMWHLLDRINHPAIACCWNTLAAAMANDAPAVAVPMLNSRIQCAALYDARLSTQGQLSSECEFGDGMVPIQKTLDRMRGIGFRRSLIVTGPASPDSQVFKRSLATAIDRLREWKIIPKSSASAPVMAV